MHLPSHLAKSRHGVFYFRLTIRTAGTTKEKRISLRTKNPQEARFKALCLSGIMAVHKQKHERDMATGYLQTAEGIAGQRPDSEYLLLNLLHRVDRQQLPELAGLPLQAINDLFAPPTAPNVRKLDIEMGGLSLRNVNSDEDRSRAVQILKALNLPDDAWTRLMAGPNPQALMPQAEAPQAEEGGTTIQKMVPRFAARRKDRLREKTLYEYGNYHRKFVQWLEVRKKKKYIPTHSITRADVAEFIDDLLAGGLAPKTITQKY